MNYIPSRWALAALATLVLTAGLAAACGSTGDDEPEAVQSLSEIADFTDLLDDLDLDWSQPEIALQRPWAEQGGTLIQLSEPDGRLELYRFRDADSLNRFVADVRGGASLDLPAGAAGYALGRVLVLVEDAAAHPELTDRLNDVLPPVSFTVPSDAVADTPDSTTGDDADTGGGTVLPGDDNAQSEEDGERDEVPDTPPGADGSSPPDLLASAVVGQAASAVPVGTGTYCWTDPDAGVGICADMIGIITGPASLPVEGGGTVEFQGSLPLADLRTSSAVAWPLASVTELESGADFRAWTPGGDGTTLDLGLRDARLAFPAALPQGDYLVNMQLFFDGGRDVSYGLLLKVVEPAADGAGDNFGYSDPGGDSTPGSRGDSVGDDGDPPDGGADPGFERVNELAPIEGVAIAVAESFPPQYFVTVQSGLPSGCAEFDRIDVERDGTEVFLWVWNWVPAPDEEIACTAIYGIAENNVNLGSDFDPGVEYSLIVNGELRETFVAQ